MDLWKIADKLGFDFGDFNDWTDAASKLGSKNRKYFEDYGASLKAVDRAQREFWAWVPRNVGKPAPEFERGYRAWGKRLRELERDSVGKLELLLAAYRRDNT